MNNTPLPKREYWHEDLVFIETNPEFKEALKMVLDELNAIYRFEDNKLVMFKSEFKRFKVFMKPVIEFCEMLKEE